MNCSRLIYLKYCLVILTALFFLASGLRAQQVDVVSLKAAYLANFVKFVRAMNENGESSHQTICLLSEDENLAEALISIARSSGSGTNFDVEKLNMNSAANQDRLSSCTALYFSEGYRKYIAQNLTLMLSEGLLLVSENDVGSSYSMISMFLVGNKLRFSVNLELVSQGNLTISSKLLRLAYKINE